MTQEIIEMAQECGLIGMRPHLDGIYSEALIAFANLVAAKALAQPEQEPVAILERDPSIGRLRVTYEDAVTELDEGVYPLYTKPQIEVGCAECGVNGGHALYCVACAEKFLISKAIDHEREECASLDIPITIPKRDYLDMSPLEIYEEALMDATLSFRAAIRARGQA